MEKLILEFRHNQTLTNLEKLKNNGINLYKLSFNKWIKLHEFKLPIERFVRLYNNDLKLIGIGIY